jgi:hypothetical protein
MNHISLFENLMNYIYLPKIGSGLQPVCLERHDHTHNASQSIDAQVFWCLFTSTTLIKLQLCSILHVVA